MLVLEHTLEALGPLKEQKAFCPFLYMVSALMNILVNPL